MSRKENMDYHKCIYKQTGFRGPLNWYQMREYNHYQEKKAQIGDVKCPCLLVLATRDSFLIPQMAHKTSKLIPHCKIKTIDATHWVMIECPEQVNSILDEWLAQRILAKI